MKTLRLGKITPMGAVDTVVKFLSDLLDNSPDMSPDGRAAGITPASMRKRFKLVDKLDANKDAEEVEIEDTDFDYLKNLFAASAYGKASRAVLEVEDRLNDAASPAAKEAATTH